MKGILAIMKEYGIEVPEDKKKDFEKAVAESYKPAGDYDTQADKLKTAETKLADSEKTLATVQATLKTYEGVDVTALNKTIDDLKADNAKKDTEYQQQLADRDFADLVKAGIQEAKGVNAKAIMALLDHDALKASKNQKADVEKAIKALTEAEDSKMLFGEPDPQQVGTVNTIGTVRKPGSNTEEASMRSAMGLPPVSTEGGK